MEEEFEEADILWPGSGHRRDSNDNVVVDGETQLTVPSVRSKLPWPERAAAPVEISRRKRRCRPWQASEHATLDQITDASESDVVDEDDCSDDGKITVNSLMIVPPHVLVERGRFGGRTAAYSMCAGKGRTLKGRDLRDVRNLVLKMTGFIEK
ncbi:protein S40-1-like [Phragmites australis]|uniref:protein S40-1-like n=1 Tax=Phragmites australis TaxID=29695 RepID=UPI002D772486|nr:protein S40-1-like [Phragmites australis]